MKIGGDCMDYRFVKMSLSINARLKSAKSLYKNIFPNNSCVYNQERGVVTSSFSFPIFKKIALPIFESTLIYPVSTATFSRHSNSLI